VPNMFQQAASAKTDIPFSFNSNSSTAPATGQTASLPFFKEQSSTNTSLHFNTNPPPPYQGPAASLQPSNMSAPSVAPSVIQTTGSNMFSKPFMAGTQTAPFANPPFLSRPFNESGITTTEQTTAPKPFSNMVTNTSSIKPESVEPLQKTGSIFTQNIPAAAKPSLPFSFSSASSKPVLGEALQTNASSSIFKPSMAEGGSNMFTKATDNKINTFTPVKSVNNSDLTVQNNISTPNNSLFSSISKSQEQVAISQPPMYHPQATSSMRSPATSSNSYVQQQIGQNPPAFVNHQYKKPNIQEPVQQKLPFTPINSNQSASIQLQNKGDDVTGYTAKLDIALQKNIKEEVDSFNNEMNVFMTSFQKLTTKQNLIGTRSELSKLKQDIESVSDLVSGYKTVMKENKSESADIREKVLKDFKLIDEATLRKEKMEDKRYSNVLKTRPLDPISARQRKELRSHFHYINTQLEDINTTLDEKWKEEDTKKKKRQSHFTKAQQNQNLYKTIEAIDSISNHLTTKVKNMSLKNKESQLVTMNLSRSISTNQDSVLSKKHKKQNESLLNQTNSGSPKKLSQLKTYLTNRGKTPVRKAKDYGLRLNSASSIMSPLNPKASSTPAYNDTKTFNRFNQQPMNTVAEERNNQYVPNTIERASKLMSNTPMVYNNRTPNFRQDQLKAPDNTPVTPVLADESKTLDPSSNLPVNKNLFGSTNHQSTITPTPSMKHKIDASTNNVGFSFSSRSNSNQINETLNRLQQSENKTNTNAPTKSFAFTADSTSAKSTFDFSSNLKQTQSFINSESLDRNKEQSFKNQFTEDVDTIDSSKKSNVSFSIPEKASTGSPLEFTIESKKPDSSTGSSLNTGPFNMPASTTSAGLFSFATSVPSTKVAGTTTSVISSTGLFGSTSTSEPGFFGSVSSMPSLISSATQPDTNQTEYLTKSAGGGIFASSSNTASMFTSTSTTTSGLFGSTSTIAASSGKPTSTGGLFGSNQSSSSTLPTTTPGLFGSTVGSTAISSSSSGMFGSTALPTTSTGTSGPADSTTTTPLTGLFGSNTTSAVATSSTGSLFGSSAPSSSAGSLFGSSAPASSAGSLFGSSGQASSAGSLFGSVATTTVATELFGSTTALASTNSLSATATATPATTGLFVSSTSTTSTGMFGSAATMPATTGLFGSSTSAASTGLFVSAATTPATTGLFGSSTSTTSTGLFGSAATTPATTGLFGSSTSKASTGLFGSAVTTPATTGLFGSSTSTTSTGLFGSAATTPATTGLVDLTTSTASSGLFGSTTSTESTGLFGSTTSTGGLFGSSTGSSSANTTGTSLFGSSVSTAAAGTGLFGTVPTSSASGGLFGTAQSTPSLFGSTTATTQSSGLFGSTTATTQSSGLFGSSSTTTGSLFGNSSSTSSSLFGGNSSSITTKGSLFGSSPSGGGGGLFGTSTSATQGSSLFGAKKAEETQPKPAEEGGGGGGFGGFGLGGKPVNDPTKNPFGALPTPNINAGSGVTGSLFGSSTAGGFGQVAASNQESGGSFSKGFGSGFATGGGSVGGGLFGSTPAAPAQAGGFGAAPAFGSPPSFGAVSAFGGAPTFGSAQPSNPAFGSTAPAFGSGATFGASGSVFGSGGGNAPTFGALAGQGDGGAFGSSNQAPTFGSVAGSNPAPTFGSAANQPSTGGFGSSNTTSPSGSQFSSWR